MTPGARSLDGVGRIAGRQRPEYGPHVYDLKCDQCGAGWCGEDGEPCPWCAEALERLREEQRRILLWPDWLHTDHGPRYDELGDDDKLVWDRTRGHVQGAGSIEAWVERLIRAVKAGLITEDEARQAAQKAKAG